MKTVSKIEGHIILYCKNHYRVANVDFLTGLRRIWSIRCGFAEEHIDKSIDRYIANTLYKLIIELKPQKREYLHEIIHEQLDWEQRWKSLSTMESLIMIYRSEIMDLQIKEQRGKRYFNLIKLPNPKKKVFQRIVLGKGKYSDYKLIN